MRKILEEFAKGNIVPNARFFERNSDYAKAMKALTDWEEKLLSTLDATEKEVFNHYISAQMEVNHLAELDKFICGYRLGMLMTMEVFDGLDDLIMKE